MKWCAHEHRHHMGTDGMEAQQGAGMSGMSNQIAFRHETTALVTPEELGRLFAQMDDRQQADFFEAAAQGEGMGMQAHYIGDRLCERGRDGKAWQFVANLCSSVMLHSWNASVKYSWETP